MISPAEPSQRILIGVCGGIAAYKICEVVSTLAKAGHEVRVILTNQAQAFVSGLTFATLARHRAYMDADFWAASQGRPVHIELGEWADVFLIAPLSANTLAKLAHGLADNLLTNTVLASHCPILLAPAMNTDMWCQASVQRNWDWVLSDARYHSLGPRAGRLACDRIGSGRMNEPAELLAYLASLHHTQGKRDLLGKHLLISTGGTREALDPVRFIGNPATGRMGLALAQAAIHRGASVTLVHGPMEPALIAMVPDAVETIAVTSAAEMEQALLNYQPQADWIVMAAAVADVRPKQQATYKLPKSEMPSELSLEFVPDIATQLAQRRAPKQTLIGFAAQTGDILAPALEKLERKGFDLIVANPVDQPQSGFASTHNQAILIHAQGHQQTIPHTTKLSLAHRIYDGVLYQNLT
jgi:phosphopantothenoylcysteine decarboxylase / phosphopantothenate---cysteine ligase